MLECGSFLFPHHPHMSKRPFCFLLCLSLWLSLPALADDSFQAASAPAAAQTQPEQSIQQTEQKQPENAESTAAESKDKKTGVLSRIRERWLKPADSDDDIDDAPKYTPRHPVRIEVADKNIKEMLEQHLPLIHYQRTEDLDSEQVGYLLEDAPNDALNMLKTEGYFNAKIDISPEGQGYLLKIDLGKRTRIDKVGVALLGDILQEDDLGSYYKDAFSGWRLPVNAPFRQEDWSSSKTSALGAVARRKYPLAEFSTTRATVNPATNSADLKVTIDSKQPVYFGDFEISGTERYPESVVRDLAKFRPGDPYSLDSLLDYQQSLEGDGHYAGASVQADFERMENDRVPVKVAVSEVKRQKFEAGLGFDSAYGLGGSLGYSHYNLFKRGYVGSLSTSIDRYQTNTSVGISQPRNNHGYYYTTSLGYSRSTTQKLEKRAVSGGLWRVRDRDGIDARLGIEFVFENSEVPDSKTRIGRSHATMLTASWKRQNIETLLRPANGYYLDGKVGVTLGKLLSSAPLARVKANAGYYFTPENKKIGTLVLRGELGYVYSTQKQTEGEVPSTLMFRTGGASSVRGYELDSIGRRLSDSSAILPDRAMAVASAEYQFPIKESFALALFHDVGGVARNFKDMTMRHGTGIGLRWFSPVAPFSFDVAYGHHDKRLRWHISLGTRF